MGRLRQIEVKLNDPISMAKDGNLVDGKTVLLTAPCGLNRISSSKIKQFFRRSIAEIQSNLTPEQLKAAQDLNKTKDTPEDIKPSEIIDIIESSSFNMCDVYDSLSELFTQGDAARAKVDGVQMTEPMFNDLSMEDMDNLLGQYIVNFLS